MKITHCCAALLLLGSCGDKKKDSRDVDDDNRMVHRIEVNEVGIDTLRLKPFTRELISNGRLEARRRSVLAFQIGGTLAAVNATNGARVAQGAALAVLDTAESALALHRAELSLEKARLAFLDNLVGLGYASGDTVTPPAEVVRLSRIRSGYADAEASYSSARRNMDLCTLRAPFAGKVADLNKQAYENASGNFCTMLDDSRLRVRFSVLESEYGLLQNGQSVVVSPYADLRKEIAGRITAINPSVDAHGQVRVDAEVANDGTLTDGMNVKVFVRRNIGERLVVPKSAVVIRDNLEVLFRYEDGRARWTYVHTSLANSDEYVVEANTQRGAELNIGDLVITSGNLNLADGSVVTPITDKKR